MLITNPHPLDRNQAHFPVDGERVKYLSSSDLRHESVRVLMSVTSVQAFLFIFGNFMPCSCPRLNYTKVYVFV